MKFENTMTFVRALKGAPASVLWALLLTRQMMTALELQQWTGYKGDNITVAVRLLVDLGWVVARSSRGPWGLADGRQLPLMPGLDDGEASKPSESDLIGFGSSTTTTTKEIIENKSSVVVAAQAMNPIFSELFFETEGVTFEDNFKMCQRHAIGNPKATEISVCSWVSPEFIDAHVKSLQPGETKGLAIVRILGNEFPRKWDEDIQNLPEQIDDNHRRQAEMRENRRQYDEYLFKEKRRKKVEQKASRADLRSQMKTKPRARRQQSEAERFEVDPDRGRE